VQVALLILLALLAAVLAAGILSAFSLYRSAENRYIRVVFPLQSAVRGVEVGMLQEENGVRGYMLTTDYRSLTPYFRAQTEVAGHMKRISQLTRDQPQLAATLKQLHPQIIRLLGYYGRLITFTRDGRLGQRRARSEVSAAELLFADFEKTATRLQSDVNTLVQVTRDRQHTTFVRSVGTLTVAGFLALVIAGTLLVNVPRRLRELYLAEEQARRRAEQGANAARALEHVSDAVVLVDDNGRVRSWNPAAERHFGVDTDFALGRRAEEVVPQYPQLAEANEQFVPADVDGERRWFSASSSSFDRGRVLTVRDVTAAHALERARTEFVATASHELRTPLTSIYGAAQTLLGRSDLSEQRRSELMRIIEQESTQLARVVDQLLLSARLDRGTLTQTTGPCDVRALARSVLNAAETRKRSNIRLAFTAPPEMAPIDCDEGLLRQVVSNLVDNALKYSPGGGRVELRLDDGSERVRISVHDQGLGIPVSEQDRIFDKFYRLDADMSRGVGGSGLGLHIARELLEQMGGSISVESVPGSGSTFTVTLPRVAIQ
jgi:two-component system phosphate regulon sensor histidine kinase PhoR